MPINAGGWVPGVLVCFSDLCFIVNQQDGLERICSPDCSANIACSDRIVTSLRELQLDMPEAVFPAHGQRPAVDCGSTGLQLGVFLGDRPTLDSLHRVIFSFANIVVQLSGGEPVPLKVLTGRTLATFLFVLHNTAQDAQRLATLHMAPGPPNAEFIGMTDYVTESIHDHLVEASESLLDSGSGEASHHLSRKCLMADTPNEHVGNDNREATP